MSQKIFNVYCDESCHLENDGHKAMVLGGITCNKTKVKSIHKKIEELKIKHGFNPKFEIKWIKVSPAKLDFYLELIDLFFNEKLFFRALVIPDKNKLDHKKAESTHEEFYYKMYFNMLKIIFRPFVDYNVYLDIKDTLGGAKVRNIHNIFKTMSKNRYEEVFRVKKIQIVLSHEINLLQLADLLIGAVSFVNQSFPANKKKSSAKLAIIEKIREKSGFSLIRNTLYREEKMNIFIWESR